MKKWYHIVPKNTGFSIYIWIIFCILPFYFIFKSSSPTEIIFGIFMFLLFFTSYRLSYLSKGGTVYVWVSIQIVISIVMTYLFGYVYFSLFLAFFIGNIQNFAGFITLYIVHLLSTVAVVTVGFIYQSQLFFPQLPFVIISVIGVILMPFSMYNRIKREKLEGQLEDANEKIAQLMVAEERQRIARDLHDTLGHKLSLIGLKSDLASKLMNVNPESAKMEIHDIQQTARTALKEVRELVSDMRGVRLEDEIIHVEQLLKAAEISFTKEGNWQLSNTPLFLETVLSMCLKEAVTNVVKHSEATFCHIAINQLSNESIITIEDNGIGIPKDAITTDGHGLLGMRERLEFVNGSLELDAEGGTKLTIRVPNVIQQSKGGVI
ncbi:two-component system sensor histidine kinase DesK [Salirhabdus euzebyi]|uniref:histidine kinase n=1 Tax=Salirhabdus euzebyi TaxID=394506 RepID=A0A841Q273_9BACI|nr:sensor histidine kinase [Salirhabdus euzebyi]MBB6452723.1 two-component system sensor histidine kinase DesK [Salirhabdus euzebyi]